MIKVHIWSSEAFIQKFAVEGKAQVSELNSLSEYFIFFFLVDHLFPFGKPYVQLTVIEKINSSLVFLLRTRSRGHVCQALRLTSSTQSETDCEF